MKIFTVNLRYFQFFYFLYLVENQWTLNVFDPSEGEPNDKQDRGELSSMKF